MEESILKAVLNKSDWLILTIFILYMAFKIIMYRLESNKAKSKEEILQNQFSEIRESIKDVSTIAVSSTIKDRIIDSINRKLEIIYAQYGSELSKELAIIVINNIFFNYATVIANEVYELQKKEYSYEKIANTIRSRISILTDEKMQELDGFIYRDKHLITYTSGHLIDSNKIIKVIECYSNQNGMLRKEIENLLSIEAGVIIKRF